MRNPFRDYEELDELVFYKYNRDMEYAVKEFERMEYLVLFIVAPLVASFAIQSILCHKVKKGILRHGTLIFPIIFCAIGVYTLLTQSGGMFGGLGVLAAILWFIIACCTVFGYGVAWLVFHIMRKGKNRE